MIESWRYIRLSTTSELDAACDAANSHHIAADSAMRRGDLFLDENDPEEANCWFYVAAVGGNTDGLAEYGKSLYTGRGITKNQATGLARIQEAAVGLSARASRFLAEIFQAGAGLPRSKQRHDYWLARCYGTSQELTHEQQIYMPWDWMRHGAPPCQPSNPDRQEAQGAYLRGRVTYEARLYPLAHCWMRISAEEGNNKAWTYLGLMSALGMGAQPNRKNAFSHMYHAARNDDLYALVYLANFNRYGVGVPADDDWGRAVMQEAKGLRGGMDAFADVEGTSVTPSDAMAMAGTVFLAAAADTMECNREPEHRYVNRAVR